MDNLSHFLKFSYPEDIFCDGFKRARESELDEVFREHSPSVSNVFSKPNRFKILQILKENSQTFCLQPGFERTSYWRWSNYPCMIAIFEHLFSLQYLYCLPWNNCYQWLRHSSSVERGKSSRERKKNLSASRDVVWIKPKESASVGLSFRWTNHVCTYN